MKYLIICISMAYNSNKKLNVSQINKIKSELLKQILN